MQDRVIAETAALSPERVLDVLRQRREEMEGLGIAHAALFGAILDGPVAEDDYIDLLVVLRSDIPISGFALIGLQEELGQQLGRTVALTVDPPYKPERKAEIDRGTLLAF